MIRGCLIVVAILMVIDLLASGYQVWAVRRCRKKGHVWRQFDGGLRCARCRRYMNEVNE